MKIEMRLPKYVRRLRGSLYYQRDYPTRLKHLLSKKTYTSPLKLKANQASDVDVSRAVAGATEAYELHLKLIENSDPESFTKDELSMAATEFLRKRSLAVGQFEYVKQDPSIAAQEQREQRQLQPDANDYASWSVPEFEEVLMKEQSGQPLTMQDKIIGEAFFKVQSAAKSKPQTLESLWGHYVKHRGIDLESRSGKRYENQWNQWLAVTGNHAIAANTLETIHSGLDRYVEDRAAAGIKGSSIHTELKCVLACLRHCSTLFRFAWVIQPPYIPRSQLKRKTVMTPKVQKILIARCLLVTGNNAPVAASIILMLQGAMMPSEIGRLDAEDVSLDSSVPHLVIRNETKTNARKRVVPIVLGADYLKEHLGAAVAWIRRTTDSTPSARIKKLMREFTGDDTLTGHCCRHTFRVNCDINGVSASIISTIGGWSGSSLGVSDLMLDYGSEGLASTEVVKSLYKASLKIHNHLLLTP
jgi:integrase